jgi:phosphatidylinositol glycan class B
MVRTYSNSLETLTTTAALSYWPWYFLQTGHSKKNHDQKDGNDRLTALCVAALGVLFRPTSAVMWSFLGALHFFQCFDRSRLLFQFVLPLGVVTGILMVIVDYIGYGQWTFVPYNFFLFNVLEGKDKLYGVHPWHWYFTQGFPVITATFLPFFMVGFRFAQVR